MRLGARLAHPLRFAEDSDLCVREMPVLEYYSPAVWCSDADTHL